MSPDAQDQLRDNMEQILRMEPVRQMDVSVKVKDIQDEWVFAGAYVQDTVAQLNSQLRRYVDENYIEEERRILQLEREIEASALAIRNVPPRKWDITLDALRPELSIPMDRPLWTYQEKPVIEGLVITGEDEDISLDALYTQTWVDKAVLRGHIDRMLEVSDSVSLTEVLDKRPLDQGLTELMAYFALSAESGQPDFSEERRAQYSWTDESGQVHVAAAPEVVYHRRADAR
jgi:hypothetical protein